MKSKDKVRGKTGTKPTNNDSRLKKMIKRTKTCNGVLKNKLCIFIENDNSINKMHSFSFHQT